MGRAVPHAVLVLSARFPASPASAPGVTPRGVRAFLLDSRVSGAENGARGFPTMQILAIYSTLHAISFHAGDVLKAVGRGGLLVRVSLVSVALLVPAALAISG